MDGYHCCKCIGGGQLASSCAAFPANMGWEEQWTGGNTWVDLLTVCESLEFHSRSTIVSTKFSHTQLTISNLADGANTTRRIDCR